MPWKIVKQDQKYCVIKTTDDSVEKCHDSEEKAKKHMSALYASESSSKDKSLPTSVRNILESKIHQSFTVASDQLFGRGYLDREQRIALSGLIGDLLGDFGEAAGDLEGIVVEPEDVSEIISKERSPGLTIFKAEDGLYYGVGIVSNNRLDRQEDILTSEGHRKFVKSINDGSYRALMGKDKPEIWLWHLPVPIGDAVIVDYDERGFLITVWKQRLDTLSTRAHEVLAKIADTLGMSHSFPAVFTEFDKSNPHHIIGYYSREFTLLPLEKAANWFTGAAAVMVKELEGTIMQIPDAIREWFANNFGDDFTAEFDERLNVLDQAANAARLPKKELEMPEDLKGQEAVEEVEAADAEVTEEVSEEEQTLEVEGAAETEEVEAEEEEVEELEETAEVGMTMTEFLLPKEQLDEIVLGVKEPFDILLKQVQEMNTHILALAERVDSIEKEEGERLAQKAAETPIASLGAQIARSVIGQSMAQLDYNKDRELHTSGPDEQTKGVDDIEPLGIGYLDEQRANQRNKRRVIPGSVFNQQ